MKKYVYFTKSISIGDIDVELIKEHKTKGKFLRKIAIIYIQAGCPYVNAPRRLQVKRHRSFTITLSKELYISIINRINQLSEFFRAAIDYYYYKYIDCSYDKSESGKIVTKIIRYGVEEIVR